MRTQQRRHHQHPDDAAETPTGATDSEITAWLTAALACADWAGDDPQIDIDRDEIVVTLRVSAPEVAADADGPTRAAAIDGRITGFREATRDQRMALATEAQHRFGRAVSWGVRCDDTAVLFTHLAVPSMTRLRQPERKVLDTLVAASVARSRSEALAWCVRLVGKNTDAWLASLRTAMADVERIRNEGPASA